MDGRRLYEEASTGTSWYTTGRFSGLEGPHRKVAARARRIAASYARMYGQEWPLEHTDLLEGIEAYMGLQGGTLWQDYTDLDYSSAPDAEKHGREHAEANELEIPTWLEDSMREKAACYWGKRNGSPWTAFGVHEGTARKWAREFALLGGHEWPLPSTPRTWSTIGPKAYPLRVKGLSWPEIADAVDASITHSIRQAKLHAESNHLPWPVPLPAWRPPTTAELEKKGRRAYELRSGGKSWKEIGTELGIWARLATKAAALHAKATGLRWPIIQGYEEDLGERAYHLRISSMEGWRWVAKEMGSKKGVVFARAKEWALAEGVLWPPKDIIPSTAQRAYELRAGEYLTWHEIGKKLGKVSDFCGKEAKKWALENELPWPIVPSTERVPEMKRFHTGESAYKLRGSGSTWVETAKALGISKAWAVRTARDYAIKARVEWPIVLFDEDVNRQAYNLRLEGFSWDEIAEKQAVNLSSARDRARKHAKASGEPWPTRVAPVRRGHSENAQRAYEMGYLERVPWKEVAEILGYSMCQSALNSAKVYAQRFDLPYHEQKRRGGTRDPTRLRRSYEMKRDNPDQTWSTISKELGYRANRAAFTAARQYAEKEGLPWPL